MRKTTRPQTQRNSLLRGLPNSRWAKGAMREPTQKQQRLHQWPEELKQALQEVEETKGDWSRGG
jgi:hypothetical protein